MAIVLANMYKASYEDLSELSCSAGTMKGALVALAKAKEDEPVQVRRIAKGIRQVEDDKPVTINVTQDVGGTAVPNTITAEVDEPVHFYARPDTNYKFSGWYKDEELLSEDMDFVYTPDELEAGSTIMLYAKFEEFPAVHLTVSIDPEGSGNVTYDSLSGHEGDILHLVAHPAEGYEFSKWVDPEGATYSTSEQIAFTLPSADTALVATFVAKRQVTLNVEVNTPSGTTAYVAPNITQAYEGERVKLYAVPTPTANFDHWEDADGGSLGTDNPLVYTVSPTTPDDVAFTAVFTEV